VGLGILNRIGKVIDHNIDKFIELISETRKNFNQKTLLYNSSGEDSPPIKNDRIVLLHIDGTGKYIAAGVLTESQGAKPGEKIYFTRNLDGAIVSKLSMLHDGHIDHTQDGNFTGNIEKNAEMTVVENVSIAIGGDKDEGVEGNRTESVGGNQEENVTGNAKYTSSNTDIISIAPVGINDGLYRTGLGPYLTAETAAAAALQSAAAAAAAQLAMLDSQAGAIGTITGLGAAINAFCAAMMLVDSAAHITISKVVK
jgi:hypothetical protein